VVQDLLAEHKSSLLISLGHESSCFGTLNSINNNTNISDSIGLWTKIINQCSVMLETKGVVRLTMVEILEPSSGGGGSSSNTNSTSPRHHPTSGDSFRDLLAPPGQKSTSIYLRHPDMKGAVLEGLCEVEIDSMPALLEALSISRNRRRHRRKSKGGGHGDGAASVAPTTIIGTLYYWENAVAFELKKPCNSTVTCVELASSNHNFDTMESISRRKSTVSLGQALRQLLLQQATDKHAAEHTSEVAPVISYRETTLTKVLQRSMESSKIVLIASVSSLCRDYDQTVTILNYLRRLLVKPGMTLTSPFGGDKDNTNTTRGGTVTPKTAKMNNRKNSDINRSIPWSPEATEQEKILKEVLIRDNRMMDYMVSDPRQRLAKILDMGTPSPSRSANIYPATDNSTVGSNYSATQSNSYSEPLKESQQVVESSIESRQGRRQPSWQHEADDDDDNGTDSGGYNENGLDSYEGFDADDDYGSANRDLQYNNDEDLSKEWASEEGIKRDLLKSPQLKGQTPPNETKGILETELYSQRVFRNGVTKGTHEDEEYENTDENEVDTYDVGNNEYDHHVEFVSKIQTIGGHYRDDEKHEIEFELKGIDKYNEDNQDRNTECYAPSETESVGEENAPESSYYEDVEERLQDYMVRESSITKTKKI